MFMFRIMRNLNLFWLTMHLSVFNASPGNELILFCFL